MMPSSTTFRSAKPIAGLLAAIRFSSCMPAWEVARQISLAPQSWSPTRTRVSPEHPRMDDDARVLRRTRRELIR